jgi:hypothetical protein
MARPRTDSHIEELPYIKKISDRFRISKQLKSLGIFNVNDPINIKVDPVNKKLEISFASITNNNKSYSVFATGLNKSTLMFSIGADNTGDCEQFYVYTGNVTHRNGIDFYEFLTLSKYLALFK